MKKIAIVFIVLLIFLASCDYEATVPSIELESVETTAPATAESKARMVETQQIETVNDTSESSKAELSKKIHECEQKLARLEEEKAEVLAEYDKECDRIIRVRDSKISSASTYSGDYGRLVIEQAKRTCEQELSKTKALRNAKKEYYNELIEEIQDEIYGYKEQLDRLG